LEIQAEAKNLGLRDEHANAASLEVVNDSLPFF
jgi:hypothetical protein